MGRVMAIDYGEKRMGIALSDESRSVAFPHKFFPGDDFDGLVSFIKEQAVEEIIVGYPLALSGGHTKASQKVDQFVDRLKQSVSAPVWKIDERLTTKEVLRELRDMGQKVSEHKDSIDSFVAQKMLERYLQSLKD